ncbi:hypothetical protein [Natrialba aegyptia]|uniref:hypothetical protein n=1 Tax=Natrialba aegyptia TaxID=129789 RepID=UPI001376339D|nr:hypothetical protein [Natrialba aegyptia]
MTTIAVIETSASTAFAASDPTPAAAVAIATMIVSRTAPTTPTEANRPLRAR